MGHPLVPYLFCTARKGVGLGLRAENRPAGKKLRSEKGCRGSSALRFAGRGRRSADPVRPARGAADEVGQRSARSVGRRCKGAEAPAPFLSGTGRDGRGRATRGQGSARRSAVAAAETGLIHACRAQDVRPDGGAAWKCGAAGRLPRGWPRREGKAAAVIPGSASPGSGASHDSSRSTGGSCRGEERGSGDSGSGGMGITADDAARQPHRDARAGGRPPAPSQQLPPSLRRGAL